MPDKLLDHLRDAIADYVVLPSPHHLVAVTLWIATTHALPAFDFAPRLVVRSAEKRSGKSRLLEIIDGTCHNPLRAINATVPAIFRSLGGEHPPTLLLDEADTIFGTRKVAEQNEDLRGLLNAGFQRGLPVLRIVGPKHEVQEFPTFAMAALAGIGRMPDTIEDRAVTVVMRRRKPSERVKPYRIRRDEPRLHAIRDELTAWAQSIIPELMDAQPDMPLEDREADTWEPLIAVADAAGGHWPQLARDAAQALTMEAQEADGEASLALQLLWDIEGIFEAASTPFIQSKDMVNRLHEIEDSPWADFELTPSKLGHRLRRFEIRTNHNSDKTLRGYRLEDFQDSFERYPRPKASEDVQAAGSRQESTDTLKSPDTLKASGENKASGQEPQDHAIKHLRTPSDALPAESRQLDPFAPSRRTNPKCVPCNNIYGPHATKCAECGDPLTFQWSDDA